MNTSGFLDQLLKSGSEMLQGSGSGAQGLASGASGLQGMLAGKGGAALAGGAAGLLLGNKRGRKMGGKALKYGGVAALGLMAYKAYDHWQSQQSRQASPLSPADAGVGPSGAQLTSSPPQTVDRLQGPQAEQHSHGILVALIAAAKSDGHVDDHERQLIDQEMAKLTADTALLRFVDGELKKPLDPAEVAAHATTPELAAEMYLASVLVIDEESFMERSYLDELGRNLKLEPGLQQQLKAHARDALSA